MSIVKVHENTVKVALKFLFFIFETGAWGKECGDGSMGTVVLGCNHWDVWCQDSDGGMVASGWRRHDGMVAWGW